MRRLPNARGASYGQEKEGGREGEEAITRFGPGGLDHSLHFPHQKRGGYRKKTFRLVRVNSGCRFLSTRSKKEKKNIAGLYPIIKCQIDVLVKTKIQTNIK